MDSPCLVFQIFPVAFLEHMCYNIVNRINVLKLVNVMKSERQYLAIDLKSFYASVECVDRGLNPLDTNLVVADESRTEKTICLAVTPSLKAYGIPGRARLFEVVEKVREINAQRRAAAHVKELGEKLCSASALSRNPRAELGYIVAPPRMARYIEVSAKIYGIYLRYIAPEDIHVYSVDEVFIDVTHYLYACNLTSRQLTDKIIRDILSETGITATAGIGTNLYLCKVAMDIDAKHIQPDQNGVRVAELDEQSYRQRLWNHQPITDFWRIGRGYSVKLARYGMFTMGDVARCSLVHSELLYKLFGVNAELLIDHAWGVEPCTIQDIKSYRPRSQSLTSGQVLSEPYSFEKARLIIREMTELLTLDIVAKGLLTDQLVLTVGYDVENLRGNSYSGEITADYYGRLIPRQAHGSVNLGCFSSSSSLIVESAVELFERICNPELSVRRMYIVANHIIREEDAAKSDACRQLSLFSDYAFSEEQRLRMETEKREKLIQRTIIKLQKRFGKNAVLKGMNLFEGATSIERNLQIGGHKA